MGKQSRLEKEAIEKREELEVKTKYNKDHEYSEDNGEKSSGTAADPYLIPNSNSSKTIYKPTVRTNDGGNDVDKDKRKDLQIINIYNKDNEYGPDSIDTSANDGQYIIR